MQVYVDDPAIALRGTEEVCQEQVAILLLAWHALGVDLAIKKGQFGDSIDWIGARFTVLPCAVEATILKHRLDELAVLAKSLLNCKTVAPLREVRSFTGKAQSIASLLFVWRPFVHMLYAAMGQQQSGAPPNCCWVRQISVPINWILCFLKLQVGDLTRKLSLDTYLRRGPRIIITTDASPWGLGGTLEIDGQFISYFSSEVTELDRQVLVLSSEPGSKNQQALEALAMLVALRTWTKFWIAGRVSLTVRADNLSTLALVAKMQPHSAQLGIIARELALDLASAAYAPDVVEHLPGVANVAADTLSRQFEPHKKYVVPHYLKGVPEASVARTPVWWKSLPAPPKRGNGARINNESVSVQY